MPTSHPRSNSGRTTRSTPSSHANATTSIDLGHTVMPNIFYGDKQTTGVPVHDPWWLGVSVSRIARALLEEIDQHASLQPLVVGQQPQQQYERPTSNTSSSPPPPLQMDQRKDSASGAPDQPPPAQAAPAVLPLPRVTNFGPGSLDWLFSYIQLAGHTFHEQRELLVKWKGARFSAEAARERQFLSCYLLHSRPLVLPTPNKFQLEEVELIVKDQVKWVTSALALGAAESHEVHGFVREHLMMIPPLERDGDSKLNSTGQTPMPARYSDTGSTTNWPQVDRAQITPEIMYDVWRCTTRNIRQEVIDGSVDELAVTVRWDRLPSNVKAAIGFLFTLDEFGNVVSPIAMQGSLCHASFKMRVERIRGGPVDTTNVVARYAGVNAALCGRIEQLVDPRTLPSGIKLLPFLDYLMHPSKNPLLEPLLGYDPTHDAEWLRQSFMPKMNYGFFRAAPALGAKVQFQAHLMQLCHFASLSNYFSGVSVCPQPLLDKCLLSSWGQSLLVFHLKGDTSPQSEFISVSAGIGGGGLADRVPKSLISIKRVALDSGDVSAAQSPEVQRRFTSISGSMAPSESLQGLLTSIVHKWCAGSAPTGFPNLVRATAHALHSERRRHLVPCPWHLGQCLQVLDRDPLLTGMRLITDVATVNIKVLAERLSWMFNWLPEFPDLPYPDIGPTMTPTAAVLPTSPDHTLLFATSTAPTDSATPLSTETYRLAVVETLLYMMLAFRHEGRNGSNPSHFEYSFRNVKSDGSTADFSSHSVPNVPDPQSSHAELFPVTTLAHMRAIVHGWLCRLVHLQHRFPWMRDTLVPSGTVLSSLGFLDVDAVMRIVDWLWSYQYVGLTPEVNPFLLPSSDGDTLTPPEPGSSDASRASTTFNVPILETMEELYFQPRKVIRSAPILGALFSVTPITRPIAPDSRRQSESGSEADGVSNGGGDSPATLDGESDKEDLNSAPNLDTAGSRRVARRVSFGTSSKALSHWVLVVCLLIVPILVLAASLFLAPIDATPPQMPHIKLPPAENVVPDEAEHVSQVSPAVLAAVNEDNYICRLLCPSHLGMHRLLPPVRKRLHPQHDQRPPPTPPPQLQQQPGTKKPPIVIPASSSPGKHTFSVRSTMDDVAAAAAGKKRDKRGLLEAANPVGRAPWVRLGPGGGRGSLSIGSVARLWVAEVWWIVSTQSLLATPDPGTMLPPPTQTEK